MTQPALCQPHIQKRDMGGPSGDTAPGLPHRSLFQPTHTGHQLSAPFAVLLPGITKGRGWSPENPTHQDWAWICQAPATASRGSWCALHGHHLASPMRSLLLPCLLPQLGRHQEEQHNLSSGACFLIGVPGTQ